jgi:hypothetical protein
MQTLQQSLHFPFDATFPHTKGAKRKKRGEDEADLEQGLVSGFLILLTRSARSIPVVQGGTTGLCGLAKDTPKSAPQDKSSNSKTCKRTGLTDVVVVEDTRCESSLSTDQQCMHACVDPLKSSDL